MGTLHVRQSISRRLTAYLVLCFVIPFTLAAFYISLYFQDTLKAEELQHSEMLLDQAGLYLEDTVLQEMENILQAVSTDRRVLAAGDSLTDYTAYDPASFTYAPGAPEQDLLTYFSKVKRAYGNIDFIFIGTEAGTYAEWPAFQPAKPYDPRTRPWYQNAMAADGIVISDPYQTQVTGELVFGVTRRITLNSGQSAVVGMTVSLDQVGKLASGHTRPDHLQYLMVLDRNGHFIASDLPGDWLLKTPSQAGMTPVAEALRSPGDSVIGDIAGVRYLISASVTPDYGWQVVSLRRLSDISHQARAITAFVSAVIACFLMISVLIMRLIILKALGDLHTVAESIHRVGEAGFDAQGPLQAIGRREDEVGLISRAVAQLVSTLREIVIAPGHAPGSAPGPVSPEKTGSDGVHELALAALEHSRQDHQRLSTISELLNHSELALARTQEQLLTAFEIANDAFFDWNPLTDAFYLNPRLRRWIGLQEDRPIRYEDMQSALHPEDAPRFCSAIAKLVQGLESSYELEYRLCTGDGRTLWLHGKGRALETGPDGTVARIMGISTDITAQKQVETQLRLINDDLEYKVSERTQELMALNEELQAMNMDMLDINAALEKEIAERRAAEEGLNQANLELSATLEHLRTAHRQLLQSEKLASLGTLVTGVAHEVNTPLGVSVTAASYLKMLNDQVVQALEQGQPPLPLLNAYVADSREAADIVLSNLQRAARLISSFKNISVDQSSDVCRRFPVKAYIEEILYSLKPQMKHSSPEITVEMDEALTLYGYPGAFSQVITNLVMNALIHGFQNRPGGRLHISGEAHGAGIRLSVADNGTGMAPEIQHRIFDPFFTTRRGSGGSGLGLFLVHNLVSQQFQGAITCSSSAGAGTRFDLTLRELEPDCLEGMA